jgi:hypothetical protein
MHSQMGFVVLTRRSGLFRNSATGGEFVKAAPEGARGPSAWSVLAVYPPASPPTVGGLERRCDQDVLDGRRRSAILAVHCRY